MLRDRVTVQKAKSLRHNEHTEHTEGRRRQEAEPRTHGFRAQTHVWTLVKRRADRNQWFEGPGGVIQ